MNGNILKNLRKEKKMTQEQLAKKLNIKQSTVASLESERRNPAIALEKTIADFFNVSVDYLNGLTTDRSKNNTSRDSLVSNFLEYLIDHGVITDIENIDKNTEQMIMNMVKKEIDIIKSNK